MTTIIRAAGVTFSKFVDTLFWVPPFAADAVYGCVAGGTLTETLQNIIGGAPGTMIGSMVVGENGATLSAANGINTGLMLGRPFSYIVVGDVPIGQAGLMGQWAGINPDLLHISSTTVALAVDGNAGSNTLGGARQTGPAFYAGTWDGSLAKIYARSATEMITSSEARTIDGAAAEPLKIGGTTYGTVNWTLHAAVAYDRALSALEIAEVYASVKAALATRSVSVI